LPYPDHSNAFANSSITITDVPVRSSWVWAGLVIILFCRPLFVGLGRTDLGNDESIYSFAVDRILETGDWLTPRSSPSETEPFLEKPPLKFWIVALPIRLGVLPHNEFGLRFWDAAFGGLAFLYVFAIGRRLGGPMCGLVAVLTLFVHRPLVMDHGLRSNNMEAAVVLSYCGGVYHFLRWRSGEAFSRRRLHALAVGLYFVLAFMTKFVAALFLPAVLAASVLLRREDRARMGREWRMWLLPACLAVVLIAPWFLYQVHRSGTEVWSIMFGQHVITRFTASLDVSHLQPWHYYFTTIAQQLRAWQMLGFAVLGLGLVLVRTWREDWPEGGLILLWIVLPLSVMSLLTSKVYHYAYPMLPPVALAAGYGAARLFGFVWSFVGRFGGAALARPVWLRTGVRAAGVALVAAVTLPVGLYFDAVSVLRVDDHPLRSARDCLRPLTDEAAVNGQGPGVLAEGALTHTFFYYLRSLGPWQRRDIASDPTVYVNLYVSSRRWPVLLSKTRYEEFTNVMRSGDPTLVERAARKAGMDPAVLAADARSATIGVLKIADSAYLLLPGAYASCAPEHITGAWH
jgi:4-amino-4-deoxy-L-arabinose transferase-like glycosyltransferase